MRRVWVAVLLAVAGCDGYRWEGPEHCSSIEVKMSDDTHTVYDHGDGGTTTITIPDGSKTLMGTKAEVCRAIVAMCTETK